MGLAAASQAVAEETFSDFAESVAAAAVAVVVVTGVGKPLVHDKNGSKRIDLQIETHTVRTRLHVVMCSCFHLIHQLDKIFLSLELLKVDLRCVSAHI